MYRLNIQNGETELLSTMGFRKILGVVDNSLNVIGQTELYTMDIESKMLKLVTYISNYANITIKSARNYSNDWIIRLVDGTVITYNDIHNTYQTLLYDDQPYQFQKVAYTSEGIYIYGSPKVFSDDVAENQKNMFDPNAFNITYLFGGYTDIDLIDIQA